MSKRPTPSNQEPSTGLWQLTYVSGATIPFSADDMAELVNGSRERNAARQLTGILLYRDGSFLQVIEGPLDAVDHLFETIHRDPRHSRILVLQRLPIQQREFPDNPLEFLFISPESCVVPPFSSPSLQRVFRDLCDGKWRRAFDCHRKENAAVPICNPFFGAMWNAAEPLVQEDQTNIQMEINHSQTAQNSGDTR